MKALNKVAFFDFCETLVNFQTADSYIKYVRENYGNARMNRIEKFRLCLSRLRIIAILNRTLPKLSINKRIVLSQLRGFSKEDLEDYAREYYDRIIKPNLIPEVINELINLQKNNWRIVIVSAGYEIYLKYFALQYGINSDDIISVKIQFKDNVSTGKFQDGDRLWDKTKKIEAIFNRDLIYSVAYSDSITDLPLLMWANEGIVINKDGKAKWPSKCGFREIIVH